MSSMAHGVKKHYVPYCVQQMTGLPQKTCTNNTQVTMTADDDTLTFSAWLKSSTSFSHCVVCFAKCVTFA